MIGYLGNIEQLTVANEYFRKVLYTGQHAQLVLMSLKPNEDIGVEVHEIVDQFLRVEAGKGTLVLNGEEHLVSDGDAFVVPAGTKHNVINASSDNELKLYTVYSPPHHKDRTIHKTKQDAQADTEDHL
ncbi:MAG: cupin domain-containing protein [bacterium]|nr:cupin domain-containing protein [bacterium]